MSRTGIIYGINGPVIYLKGNTGFKMSEMVYVGEEHLVGEVIALTKDTTTVQVFEETSGLKPGETVTATGDAISVTLGPGILDNIFDGIQRPLSVIAEQSGKYISRGMQVDSLDTEKKWNVKFLVKEGDEVHGGTIFAQTQEACPEMADSYSETDKQTISGNGSACHRTANFGYVVSDCKRRNSGSTWRIWNRKDDDPASDCKVVRCRHYCIYWMWRTWK